MIGVTLCTTFVYGQYAKEFSTFRESFIFNIQIILFLEKTDILERTNKVHRPFLTVLLLFIIICIRLLFLRLFYAIFIEYLRVEYERLDKTWSKT